MPRALPAAPRSRARWIVLALAPLALGQPRVASGAAVRTQTVQVPRTDTIVKLAGKPIHAGVAQLVEEVNIGVVDGAEEYMFGDVAEVAVAKDGSIYIFDRRVPALRKYDASGKYVRTLGRRGQGPGEYLSGGGLAIHPDGRVLLWDTATGGSTFTRRRANPSGR